MRLPVTSTRLFLNASLAEPSDQSRNVEVLEIIGRFPNLSCYAPQIEVPLGTPLSAQEILQKNLEAIWEADVVLTVLDNPGVGVGVELGYTLHAAKPIIAFRPSNAYLGKMLEGLWESLPADYKATTLDGLHAVLSRLHD